MRIQHSYLMWVGADNYETISEYVDEVRKLGVSKRLPGFGMANALAQPGALVYVAHDDGAAYSCPECIGKVECSGCRTWMGKIARWQADADVVTNRYGDERIPRGKARIVEIRAARIAHARSEMKRCDLCDGEGTYECGTGGYVVRADKQTRMDYRAYNYWMRQPHKFDEIVDKHMCMDCGGTGKRPAAVVFGAFVPEIEVVVSGREHEIAREQIGKFERRLTLASVSQEPERRGAQREPGYYATAKPGKPSKRASAVARELVTRRAVRGECEVIGDFILFAKPVKAPGQKRFRAVKRYSLRMDDQRAEATA